jgi:hypothetical protein
MRYQRRVRNVENRRPGIVPLPLESPLRRQRFQSVGLVNNFRHFVYGVRLVRRAFVFIGLQRVVTH